MVHVTRIPMNEDSELESLSCPLGPPLNLSSDQLGPLVLGVVFDGDESPYPVTFPETNIFAPENRPKPSRKVVFQPSICRGYVSFREGIWG